MPNGVIQSPVDRDLRRNMLLNFRVENRTTSPNAAGSVEGLLYYDSNSAVKKLTYCVDGSVPTYVTVPRPDSTETVSGLWTFSRSGAPFAVSNSTVVTNLNADKVDGFNASVAVNNSTVAVRDTDGTLKASDPVDSDDLVTKGFAEQMFRDRDVKDPVVAATTGNVNLSSPGASIDGVTLSSSSNDRVLIKDQSTASQNGVYIYNGASSAMTRAADVNADSEVSAGLQVFVLGGTTHGGGEFTLQTADPITVGSTALSFVQTGGQSIYSAGNGIVKSGNTFHFAQSSSYTAGALPYANGTSTIGFIQAAATGNVLKSAGTGQSPVYGKVDVTSDITGVIPIANGGTGSSTQQASGRILITGGNGVYTTDAELTYDSSANKITSGSAQLNYIGLGVAPDTTYRLKTTGKSRLFNTTDIALLAETTGSNTAIFNATSTPPNYIVDFRLAGNSKVRIEPDGDLHVVEKISVGSGSPTYDIHVIRANARIAVSNSVVENLLQADSTIGYIGTNTNHKLILKTNNSSRIEIENDGKVKVNSRLGVGVAPITDATAVVNGALQASFGHFTGWAAGGDTGSGLGLEVGISSGDGYVMAYDRTAGAYSDLRLVSNASQIHLSDASGGKIEMSGRVGIGVTPTANAKLHVRESDPGSFLYDTSADTLIVEGNGDAGITIATAAGNTQKICFSSPDDPTGAEIKFSLSNGLMRMGTTTGSGQLVLQSGNGVEAIRINSSGNLGLNNTDIESWHSVYAAIEFKKSALMYNKGTGSDLYLLSNTYYDGSWKYKASSLPANYLGLSSGGFQFKYAAAATADNSISWSTAMLIDSAGQVTLSSLITSTSDTNVIVESSGLLKKRALNNVAFSGFGSGTVGKIPVWTGNTTTLGDSILSQSSSTVYVNGSLSANSTIASTHNNSNRAILTYGGGGNGLANLYASDNSLKVRFSSYDDNYILGQKVGIGTAGPGAKLHIKGDNGDQLKLDNDGDQFTQINFANNNSTKTFIALDHAGHKFIIGAQGSYSDLDYISFRPDGTNDDLVIERGGNVGIGISSNIAAKLDVIGRIRSSFNSGDYFEMGSSDSGGFLLGYSGGTEVVNVRTYGDSFFNGGNVGIGTDDPDAKLEIRSDGSAAGGAEIRLTHDNNNSTDVVSTINFANNAGSVAMIQGGTTGANNNGYISLFTDNAGTSSEKMRIDSSGNVGIGISSNLSAKLEVNGQAIFGQFPGKLKTYSDNAYAGLYNGSELGSDEAFYIGNGKAYFATDGATALTIDDSQNVGIGITSIGTRLHVHKTSGHSSTYITTDANSSGSSALWFAHNYSTTADWAGIVFDTDDKLRITNSGSGSGTDIVIDSSNNVGIGTDDIDSRLHIAGSGGDVKLTIERTDARTYSIYTDSNSNLHIKDESGNANRLTIDSSGNVIIGNGGDDGGATIRPGGQISLYGLTVDRSGSSGSSVDIWDANSNSVVIGATASEQGLIVAAGGYVIPGYLKLTSKALLSSGSTVTGLFEFSNETNARLYFTRSTGNRARIAQVYETTIGDASATSFTVTHNLGGAPAAVTMRDTSSGEYFEVDWSYTNANNITVSLQEVATSNQYTVTIVA